MGYYIEALHKAIVPHLEEGKKESLQWHSLAFLSLPACVMAPNYLPQAKTLTPS